MPDRWQHQAGEDHNTREQRDGCGKHLGNRGHRCQYQSDGDGPGPRQPWSDGCLENPIPVRGGPASENHHKNADGIKETGVLVNDVEVDRLGGQGACNQPRKNHAPP